MTTTCATHHRPTSGGAWCTQGDDSCRRTVKIALTHIPAYFADLENVRTRQTRYGDGVATLGSIGHTMPLVVDERFLPGGKGSIAYDTTRKRISSWTGKLCQRVTDRPGRSMRDCCDFLIEHLTELASMPWAGDFMADVLDIEHRLAAIVDRPAESWYAGICGAELGVHDGTTCACACHTWEVPCDVPGGCGIEYGALVCQRVLYATPGNPVVKCRDCQTRWPIADRRKLLVREAEDHNATVEIIAKVVTTLVDGKWVLQPQEKVSARIRTWAQRGKIAPVGTRVVLGRPRPVYRIGDVLDLLAVEATS